MIAAPLHFPSEAEVPETREHFELRLALFMILKLAFGDRAWIGSDQFVYWNAREPRRCLAPDAFVKLGGPDAPFPIWKAWERGAPEVAVEIVSPTDERRWADKLRDYGELGVREVVRFHPEATEGRRLEIWDRVGNDLILRAVQGESGASNVLEGNRWIVGTIEDVAALRVVGPDGSLLPTPIEIARMEAERARMEAERARMQAERAEAAERRIAELEAELAKRNG